MGRTGRTERTGARVGQPVVALDSIVGPLLVALDAASVAPPARRVLCAVVAGGDANASVCVV